MTTTIVNGERMEPDEVQKPASATNLRSIPVEKPDPDVIDFCRALLARAESGETLGVMVCEMKREHWSKPYMTDGLTFEQTAFGLRLLNLYLDKLMQLELQD